MSGQNLKCILWIGLFFVITFSSCIIQKRVHTSGYFIEWNTSNRKATTASLSKTYFHKPIPSFAGKVSDKFCKDTLLDEQANSLTASAKKVLFVFPQKEVDQFHSTRYKKVTQLGSRTILPNRQLFKRTPNPSEKQTDSKHSISHLLLAVLIVAAFCLLLIYFPTLFLITSIFTGILLSIKRPPPFVNLPRKTPLTDNGSSQDKTRPNSGVHKTSVWSSSAITGFILSVLSIPLFFTLIVPILGLIFSSIGMKKTSHGKRRGRALAIWGLILCILFILLAIALIIAFFETQPH